MIIQLPVIVQARHQKQRNTFRAGWRTCRPRRDDRHIGQTGVTRKVFILAIQFPATIFKLRQRLVRAEIAAAVRFRHPCRAPGFTGQQRFQPLFLIEQVLVDRIRRLIGDDQRTVQPRIGQQVTVGKMLMPRSALIRRAIDERDALQQIGVRGAELRPIDPAAIDVVHRQDRHSAAIDVLGHFVGTAAGHCAEIDQ